MPWGDNMAGAAPAFLTANADVTLTASTAVTAIHSQSAGTGVPLFCSSPDPWILCVTGVLTIVLGGTAPSAMVISIATTSGTAIKSYTVEPALLVNSAELVIPIAFFIPASSSLWVNPGTDPLIQVNGTGQASTCKKVGSQALAFFIPGAQ